jgi:flagellar protein FlaF
MSYSRLAYSAYQTTRDETADSKSVEIEILRRAILKLKPYCGSDFYLEADSAAVLSENLRLWDIFSVDLLDEKNDLPEGLRLSLLQLANFVRTHTLGLYRNEGRVDVLVDINRAVLDGLSGIPVNKMSQTGAA